MIAGKPCSAAAVVMLTAMAIGRVATLLIIDITAMKAASLLGKSSGFKRPVAVPVIRAVLMIVVGLLIFVEARVSPGLL